MKSASLHPVMCWLVPSLLIGLLVPVTSFGAWPYGFDTLPTEMSLTNVRSMSLGYSDFASGRGPSAITSNPAAPFSGQTIQFGAGYRGYLETDRLLNFALTAELGAFRLGLALRQDHIEHRYWFEFMEANLFETIFSRGPTSDNWISVVGLAWNHRFALSDVSELNVTAGANWRRLYCGLYDGEPAVGVCDAGVTPSWRLTLDRMWFAVNAAAVWENLLNDTGHDVGLDVPAYFHAGATLSAGFRLRPSRYDTIRLSVSMDWQSRLEKKLSLDRRGCGIEATLEEVLSLRIGDYDPYSQSPGFEHWGFGLQTPPGFLGSLSLRGDVGTLDSGIYHGHYFYELTIGYDF